MKLVTSTILALAAAGLAAAQLGEDYIDEVPKTVYESDMMSPQNMDFDAENNMFIAHSGWYNDRLVHYYKFRMYTPGTYPGLIAPGVESDVVPIQKIWYVTTTGDFTGVVGNPIIEFHTADGLNYSDFMNVQFVEAPQGYVADTFKSPGDVVSSGATITPSDIMLNIPVVPTGATLQNPHEGGTAKAPIAPVDAWYKGQQVTTYVFEVTSDEAKAFFNPTRTADPNDPAFSITITQFASPTLVNAIPLWHVNQYTNGVVKGENAGGPSDMGMRNIINLDRVDGDAYSPLWSILWVTELPMNYLADQVSNAANMVQEDGFVFVPTPMFVNCPDIGNVSDTLNEDMTDMFDTVIDASQESNMILGSHMTLIMQADVPVKFKVSNAIEPARAGTDKGDPVVIATTMTNMMGAYEYKLMSSDIPAGTTAISVVAKDEVIRTIVVENAPAEGTNPSPTPGAAPTETSAGFYVKTAAGALATIFGFFLL